MTPERFAPDRLTATKALERKRARDWSEGWCVAGIGFVLIGLTAIWPPGMRGERFIVFDIEAACTALLGEMLVACGFTDAIVMSRRLTKKVEWAEHGDGPS